MPSKETFNEQTTSEETLTTEENDCEIQSRVPKNNSVYDFLYQDVRRVGSFLAQFDEYGVRQSIRSTESVSRTQSVKGAALGTIGLPAILGASATIDATTADETKDLAEHTFDPLWANSRRLLNYLSEHDLIEHDLWVARLGRFVLVEGSISIIDTRFLTPVFEDGELFEALVRQACAENKLDLSSPQATEIRQNLSIISKMPKAIHLYVYKEGSSAWATVTEESLVTTAHDIAFKHGALIRGHWNVLGILDAWPDFRQNPSDDDPNPKTLDEIGANILADGPIKVAANFINLARNFLGRPREVFGITPLLIFREVSG